jgi:transposase
LCYRLKLIWADGAYEDIVYYVRLYFGWTLDIVRRPDDWLGRYRRLSRDFEHTVSSGEATVYVASIRRMLKLAAI